MTKCQHCPVPDPMTCPRWTTGHARYCELVDPGHAAYYPAIVPSLIRRAESPSGNIATAPPNPHLARIAAARSCHHRIDPQKCGCSEQARCDIGFGDFDGGRTATINRCLSCPITTSRT